MNLNVSLTALVLLAAASVEPLAAQTPTAFQTGEQVTGSTTQCYYLFGGRRYTRTVPSDQLRVPRHCWLREIDASHPSSRQLPRLLCSLVTNPR